MGKNRERSFSEAFWPKLMLTPSFVVMAVFIYGFILWTGYLSLTRSRMLPMYEFEGLGAYEQLFANPRWHLALENLAVFGGLFIVLSLFLGLMLAIFLDQKIRCEGFLRTLYLYPMALSFIVTGTAWKWILNPAQGIQQQIRALGWSSFEFDWLVHSDRVIYTLVLCAVWQASGFMMALFLAGLRGVDENILKAAAIDGASSFAIYRRVIIPSLAPVFFTGFMILSHLAIKSFDLVMALTGGGPGYSSDLPATFMYAHAFKRNQMALGSASSMVMLMGVIAVLVPILYSEIRRRKREHSH